MKFTVTLPENYVQPQIPGLSAWAEALESGKYKKGRDLLKDGDRYCCLGVLCKLRGTLIKQVGILGDSWRDMLCGDEEGFSKSNEMHQFLGHTGKIPEEVRVVVDDNRYHTLAEINDESGLGFKSIAAIIRIIWQEGDASLPKPPLEN